MPTFLDHYLAFNANNECPPIYHKWSGLFLLACAAQKRVCVNLSLTEHSYFLVHPNLYVGLIGTQGGRKSVAKDIAYERFLMPLFPELPQSASVESAQMIIKRMASDECRRRMINHTGAEIECTPFVCIINELKDWLSINPGVMVDFLTNIYDRQSYNASTIKHGAQIIPQPCMNLIACETPEWIVNKLKMNIISGGFSRRIIYVNNTKPVTPVTFPTITETELAHQVAATDILKRVPSVHGMFEWTNDARRGYDAWYRSHMTQTESGNVVMAGYARSKHIQLLKVAMLLALAEPVVTLKLTPELLGHAQLLLDEIEPDMARLSLGVGRNELAVPMFQLLDIVRRHGGFIAEKQLRIESQSNLDGAEFYGLLNDLRRTEQIVIIENHKCDDGKIRKMIALPECVKVEKPQEE